MATVDTRRAEHRTLRFATIDDLLAEIDRIVAADRAGTLRRMGNWTTGQVFGHLAAWINYGYDGYPPESHPPWIVRMIVKMMKNSLLYKPMRRGMRIPRTPGNAGTFGTDQMSAEDGAQRLRAALLRLKGGEPPLYHSPALGPLTHDERVALQLRHAELHLGYLHP